ncbi:carbonic anhydrase family protein, partial [uncultured Deefgea sp.]|uniref:carbonic anhydrase family protein n=1 Tax=uncultured Deefgea sp. TaxID=1304914 RepID=UPI0025957CE2
MLRRTNTLAIALAFVLTANVTPANEKPHKAKHDPLHWSYEGETGPSHWGDMKSEFNLCRDGKQQSPINISEVYNHELEPLQFQYRDSKTNIQNNGHTIQLNYDPGSFLVIGNDRYQLLQFHF